MATQTLASEAGAKPVRIGRVQKVTLTLLFIAGILTCTIFVRDDFLVFHLGDISGDVSIICISFLTFP